MIGITILTNSGDFLQKSNNFENMRTLFLVTGILFLIISIVLFIRFDIKQIIFMNVKHKQKSVPNLHKPDGRTKANDDATESLSEETALLENECEKTAVPEADKTEAEVEDRTEVLESDRTEVLDEVQLEFHMEKSVEMYSDEYER